MLRFLCFACCLVISVHDALGSALESAQRARALLGPDVWSQILRIDNAAARSVYPATVYALVFETGGILWFYTEVDGTQSFSLHRHNLAAEKADFRPLLKAIEPGFGRFEVVKRKTKLPAVSGPLPNGCMIESLAAARQLVAQGQDVRRASLVSFYFNVNGTYHGHTVLCYEAEDGAYVIDPPLSNQRFRVGDKLPDEPILLARQIADDGVSVIKARALALNLASLKPAMVAGVGESDRREVSTMMN